MLTYSVLMELASQRDAEIAEIAEAARATRAEAVPLSRTRAPRDRARVATRFRALVSRA